MKRSFLFALSAMALLATSCDNKGENDGGINGDETAKSNEVSFTSIIGLYTTRATSSNFEDNDEIGVYAYDKEGVMLQSDAGVDYNNVKYKYSDDVFKYNEDATDKMIKTTGETICYVATSPYIDGELPTDFAIAADQSTKEGYNSSDLLIARGAESNNSNTPALRFWHKLSNVKITLEGDYASVDIAEISIKAKNNVVCNIEDDTYSATGAAATITPYKNSATEYLTVVAPQTFAAGTQILSMVDSNGTSYEFTPDEAIELKSGEQTEITITIIGNSVSFKCSANPIGDWTSIKDMTGDTASLYTCDLSNFKSGSDMVLICADKWVVTSEGVESPSTEDFANFNATLAELQKKNSTIELEFKGIKTIPEGAIKSDSPITVITSITSDATEIADNAFSACPLVANISFPEVQVVGDNVFSSFELITSAVFANVTSLGSNVFCEGFTQLSAATIDGVALTSIQEDTFGSAENMANVDLRLGFSNKGKVSYSDGHKLTIDGTSYTFKSITDPSGTMFQEGYSLSQISATSIPSEDVWIITDENSDNSYTKTQFDGLIRALVAIYNTDQDRRVTLNFKNMKYMPAAALGNATGVTPYGLKTTQYSLIAENIIAPELIELGSAAFKFCNVVTVDMPSLKVLGDNAFSFQQGAAKALTSVRLATNEGAFLTKVGANVFKLCNSADIILGASNTEANGVKVEAKAITAGGVKMTLGIGSVTVLTE